jgi:hypothetical protein
MRQETITVYSFDELPTDKAKERARDWWKKAASDDEFWDFVYEDCAEIFRILGIDSKRHTTGRDGKIRDAGPEIYFRGFWSQGDGACFVGRYSYAKGAAKAIRERKHFYSLGAEMTHRDSYYHEYSVHFEVWDRHGTVTDVVDKELSEIMRRLMRWIYKALEDAHENYFSDEHVEESIRINEYEFEEDGSFHG